MKHTDGPWYVRQDREFYNNHEQPYCISTQPEGDDEGDDFWICRCMDSWDKEMKANANLIAAAPELLEACYSILNCETAAKYGVQNAALSGLDWKWHFDKVRKAIAKAEGH